MSEVHLLDAALDALVALLVDATPAGPRVVRARAYPPGDLPALSVHLGDGETLDSNTRHARELVDVIVTAYVEAPQYVAGATPGAGDDSVDAAVLAFDRDLRRAVHASDTLGLAYVERAWVAARARPDLSAEGKRPRASCEWVLRVLYATDYDNPAALTG